MSIHCMHVLCLELLHAMQVYWSLQSFEFYNINGASETKRFADMFDRFFDCLNVKNLGEYKKKKKPNLSPYYDPDEECLTVSGYHLCISRVHHFNYSIFMQWLEKEFLGYLKEWKASVDNRSGFTEAEKAMMCLSKETLEGLHMTGNSTIAYCNIEISYFFTM